MSCLLSMSRVAIALPAASIFQQRTLVSLWGLHLGVFVCGPSWRDKGLHLCVLVWAIHDNHSRNQKFISYLTTILVTVQTPRYKFGRVWKHFAKVSRPTKSRTITNVMVSCGSHQIIISTKSPGVLGTAPLCISKEFILTKSHRVLILYCNIDFPILADKCFVWDCIIGVLVRDLFQQRALVSGVLGRRVFSSARLMDCTLVY